MRSSMLNRWSLVELPRLNRAIIAGDRPASSLRVELARLLALLPESGTLYPGEAEQLVVHLGLAGASVARHYQEQDPVRKATPERAFEDLAVGPAKVPFLAYFRGVAQSTETGHYRRDSYASLVRWNAPTTEVCWAGETLAVVPGAFPDGEIRTYTGDRGEFLFFELLKHSEALEMAVNDLIEPLTTGSVDVLSPDGIRRMRTATVLMVALRQLNSDFGARPAGDGMTPDHFLDVFRQFAVHWEVGDIPPSGAQDAEFLKRDFLLGIDFPDYELLVRRIFGSLLDVERQSLTTSMRSAALPAVVLAAIGVTPADLSVASPAAVRTLVHAQPSLAACHLLLQANARFAGTHLQLTKKFLFREQQRREAVGMPDNALVSNHKGTTGMTENLLERLVQARKRHPLVALRQVAHREIDDSTGIPEPPPIVGDALAALVHFSVRHPAGSAYR